VAFPFRLKLELGGEQSTELVCTGSLRLLPGKRLVCLGEWNGRQVVAKVFLDAGSGKRHCAREERGVKGLVGAGIKTPELLLKGELGPDRAPVLAFQRVMPAKDLLETWKERWGDEQRLELLCRAVEVIGALHQAGLKQDDLHFKNFLLSGADIYIIDGDGVDTRQIGKPLSEGKSLMNLGLFFAQLPPQFHHLASDAFRAYVEKRGWRASDHLVSKLLRNVQIQWDYRKDKYLLKIYRECSAFVCQNPWGRFMVCDRDFYDEEMARFLEDPDPVMNSSQLLKEGNSSTVALVDIGGQRLVVKRYNIKSGWHAIKRGPRPSRAWVSWRNAHLLTMLGISSAKPIALMEMRWGPLRSKAYLVSEYVEGVNAYRFFHSDRTMEIDREVVVERFGHLLQLLADASISHGDFKSTNFIVGVDGLSVMDLDAMHQHRFRGRFRAAFRQDLQRLMKDWEDLPEVEELFRQRMAKMRF
jgi:tRNA A-37 threonylcarbamoyl transferase component Bud32